MSAAGGAPGIEIADLQSRVAVDLDRIRTAVTKAMPLCLARVEVDGAPLPGLAEVEVSVISDEQIAGVHGEFLDDPTPTDVITFDHGEILVSADTAAARALEFGHGVDQELALYIIHGLLHLAGYLDKEEADFERMRQAQTEILAEVWDAAL